MAKVKLVGMSIEKFVSVCYLPCGSTSRLLLEDLELMLVNSVTIWKGGLDTEQRDSESRNPLAPLHLPVTAFDFGHHQRIMGVA